ncbi:unnamed protein product [Paramecium sonneborni]|uniref:Uncharacterized protein n=1 Tax=Paramecium sonneborni TaxID=65129 RepID=A0A8S1RS32_9CILI|nr:unnamed protein product [Paramecium sonneborni]
MKKITKNYVFIKKVMIQQIVLEKYILITTTKKASKTVPQINSSQSSETIILQLKVQYHLKIVFQLLNLNKDPKFL